MSDRKPPEACADMPELRQQIDMLDAELIRMLTVRAGYIDRAIRLKQQNGWPARIPDRVEEVVENVRRRALAEGLDPDLAEDLWRPLIDWSIAREARVIRET
ncbi:MULTISPECIES: chorismate mutase [Pseudophaeobacter]|jgi:isochorismate pyruvate lyase|uniref:chorismate mutase n=1 Tax=Pseudophaeobacter TaxID=1541822 RepID=UPI00242CE559|nr:chorismate mutase [Pseudophaeobacter profundi]